MELVLSIISVALGVAGLAFGIYQNRSKAEILRLTRESAWSMYRSCYRTFLKIWSLHQAYRESIPTDLAKSETSIRELHQKCIEHVLHQYTTVTEDDLARWKTAGKLEDDFSVKEFRKYLEL